VVPCDKTQEILSINEKLDYVIELLHDDRVEVTKIKKDVGLHKKLWGGLISFLISIGLIYTQQQMK
jgi:hypothetical protein